MLEREGQSQPRVLLQSQFNETNVRLSPDGRWILYQSSESGRSEVYISPFAGGGGKWQVSAAGGVGPRWRRDGRQVFYVANGGTTLMGVPVDLRGTSPQVGSPLKLFEARFRTENYRGYGVGHVYDVAPDGKRFLVNVLGAEPAMPSSVTVVTNWTSLLR